ncbi:MAG: hypothetical protein LBL75_02610 [Rickettsiales bacterium]|jgi:transposase-like protein|nr:hypothetical protein [Rickettsiales bacterium]
MPKFSRLSAQKRNKLFQCFAQDLTATKTAVLVAVNRNTVNSYFSDLRMLIYEQTIKESKHWDRY